RPTASVYPLSLHDALPIWPATLRDGDGLVLDDGGVMRIAGLAEALVEVRARRGVEIVRLAWHVGNRHTDVQIVGECLRIRRDHVDRKSTRLNSSHVKISYA